MNKTGSAKSLAPLFLSLLLLAPPAISARQTVITILPSRATVFQQSDPSEDAITFDNLLMAGSYVVYAEVRNVGQQMRSGGFAELLEPLMPLLGTASSQIARFTDFINSHANTLSRSRAMFATMPAKPSLPQLLVALELPSPEAAQEFAPQFQEFLQSLMLANSGFSTNKAINLSAGQAGLSPFFVKRVGSLLVITESPLKLDNLRPEGGKPLSTNAHFRAARDRFYSEALFVYYDIALGEQTFKQRYETNKAEDQNQEGQAASATADHEVSATIIAPVRPPVPEKTEAGSVYLEVDTAPDPPAAGATRSGKTPRRRGTGSAKRQVTAATAMDSQQTKTALGGVPASPPVAEEVLSGPVQGTVAQDGQQGLDSLWRLTPFLFGSLMNRSGSPEALAAGVAFEDSALILRALLVNDSSSSVSAIPFLSLLIAGPPVEAEAASYMPIDTDIFIGASLDLPKMYDAIAAMMSNNNYMAAMRTPGQKKRGKQPTFESEVAALEKKYRFKIREELLASLGNEVAIGLPARLIMGGPPSSQMSSQGVVVLVSVENKELLKAKILSVLEAAKLKAPGEKGITEKRGDFEISGYGKVAFAFINNFLILAPDVADVRRAVESFTKNQTLAASRDFRNYMRWQPRQTVAQVYVSSALIKGAISELRKEAERMDEKTREFFSQLNLEPEPVTYGASADVLGPLYELRLPKSLIVTFGAMMAADANRPRGPENEMAAKMFLQSINDAQKGYHAKHGKYGTLEELGNDVAHIKMMLDSFGSIGYKLELTVLGNRYEATATPSEYGKAGRLSFYIDESGILRAADHEGKPASATDKPVGGEQK